MGQQVLYNVREGVAQLTVDNPPVNALTQPVRAALLTHLQAAIDSPDVGAIVILAQGRTFPAGADLRDYQQHALTPSLADVCTQIEAAPKPVLAAIHGTALGGGFELALACHFRLIDAGAQLGLPDVALGLVPSAGGSQRLPRIAGARAALDILLSGRPVTAETAVGLGLADKVIQKNLARAAFGSARNFATDGVPPRPTRARSEGFAAPHDYLDEVRTRREQIADDPRAAMHRAVDLVEAALLLPFEAGLAMERAFFEDLVDSDQSHGLRHAFLAERRTTRIAEVTSQKPRQVRRIGVVGGGRLGAGVVRACLAAGLPVTLIEQSDHALDAARRRIGEGLARDVDRGRLPDARRDAQLEALTVGTDPEMLAAVDMVIEAVTEDAEAKRAAFGQIGAATGPGTIVASAGLGPDLAALGVAAGRPEDVIGMRFFAPAHRVRLVEVVASPAANPDLVATGVAVARGLGKIPVIPGAGGTSLALPVFSALFTAAAGVLAAGATPVEVDTALRDYGFALGPLQLCDLAGLDRLAALGWPGLGGVLLAEMVNAGLIGQKGDQGFYTYTQGRQAANPTPQMAEIAMALRAKSGLEVQTLTHPEIAERVALAMANAGAHLVASGVARRPSDIDATMLTGFAYPRWRGGPMEVADRTGLLQTRNRLRELAQAGQAKLFAPAPLFDELIKNGLSFDRLNARKGI